MKNAQSHQPALTGRCEYLGLKDDSQTCLAFPSNWNYCYHARRPESVRLEYQRQYCHTPNHVQCPVFQNEKIAPLPPEVRDRRFAKKDRTKRAARRIPALLFIFALALLVFWLVQTPLLLIEIKSGLFGKITARNLPTMTVPVIPAAMTVPQTKNPGTVIPPVSSPVSTQTNLPTPPDYSLSTSVLQIANPSPAGICGYPLDTPFGKEHRFIIHQAQDGDSLAMYANYYRTSIDAIQAVNYQLPIPLRKEWVLVIPIGESQIEKVPSFEPYLVSEANISIENLAGKLSADPLALEQYNGFSESCRTFSGWLLIPRQKPTP